MRQANRNGLCLGFALISAFAIAEDEPAMTFERDSVWRSRYVWRGLVLEPKGIHETSTTVGFGNVWLNFWTYGRNTEVHLGRGHREVDFTLGFDVESGGWTFSPSFILYTYPSSWEPRGTAEFALEASGSLGGGFGFRANAYLDVAADRGASFLEIGFGYERDLGSGFVLDALLLAGGGDRKFNLSNYDVRRNAWNALYGEIGLAKEIGGGLSLRVAGGQSRTLDRRLRDASERPHNSYWTVSLSYAK